MIILHSKEALKNVLENEGKVDAAFKLFNSVIPLLPHHVSRFTFSVVKHFMMKITKSVKVKASADQDLLPFDHE